MDTVSVPSPATAEDTLLSLDCISRERGGCERQRCKVTLVTVLKPKVFSLL